MIKARRPLLLEFGTFAVVSGLLFFLAWLAATGRVAYTLLMLWIAAGLAFAAVDLIGYEIVKKERRR